MQELIRAAIQPVGDVGAPAENKNAKKSQNKVRNTNIESKSKSKRADDAAYVIGRLKKEKAGPTPQQSSPLKENYGMAQPYNIFQSRAMVPGQPPPQVGLGRAALQIKVIG